MEEYRHQKIISVIEVEQNHECGILKRLKFDIDIPNDVVCVLHLQRQNSNLVNYGLGTSFQDSIVQDLYFIAFS